MCIQSGLRAAFLALGLAVAASAAHAATLTESGLPSGAFGSSFDRLTQVAAGFDTISGTGSQNAYDNFVFSDLRPGAQTITLTFAAPTGIGPSYSAGGTVLYKTSAFAWGWDGASLPAFQLDQRTPTQTLSLSLDDSFTGNLYLALNFTHGSNFSYTISAPGNALAGTASPVPVPAGLALIATGAAALGALGFRRRRAAAA